MQPADQWNERYSGHIYVYGTIPNDFLVSVLKQIPIGPVLCLAEGEGRNAVFLAKQGYQVVAIDFFEQALAKTAALAKAQGVTIETHCLDLQTLEIVPNQWSGIVAIFAHLPAPIRSRLHQQVVAGLVPEGAFILEAYTPAQLEYKTGGPPVAELMMDLATLRSELTGLDLVIAQECTRNIHEGILHNGMSAVVQILGIKHASAAPTTD
jgi:SAM-dependent methyltransferase